MSKIKCENCKQELEKNDVIRIKNALHCQFCLAKVKSMKEIFKEAYNYPNENKNQGLTSLELYDKYKYANNLLNKVFCMKRSNKYFLFVNFIIPILIILVLVYIAYYFNAFYSFAFFITISSLSAYLIGELFNWIINRGD